MRLKLLFLIVLTISSCGLNKDKAAKKDESIRLEYLQKGKDIAALTQTELLRNVSLAMKEGGPGYAIEFCNLHAMLLKDSLSILNNCEIRRIALKYRNPKDMPQSKTEQEQLEKYQIASERGDSLNPEIYIFNDRIEYYQPIFINNGACLVCHGNPGEQVADETFEMIKERYPDDLATGFSLNDFRGSWKITFMKP